MIGWRGPAPCHNRAVSLAHIMRSQGADLRFFDSKLAGGGHLPGLEAPGSAPAASATRGTEAVTASPEPSVEDSPRFGESFRDEFEKHFPSIFRYLDRLSGDSDLAADVAQEAFIRLYRRGALPENTVSWLVVVARNLFWNARSKSRRRRRLLAGEDGGRIMSDANPSPASSLETSQCQRRVRAALGRLPEREREMLLLRYEGFSYREIAEMLDVTETSVGTLLVRAKRAFRRTLEEQGDAP